MIANAKLAGAVGNHHRPLQQALVADRAPHRPLAGQSDRTGRRLPIENIQRVEMLGESRGVGEFLLVGAIKRRERRFGKTAPTHIVERGGVDDKEARSSPKDRQEIRPRL